MTIRVVLLDAKYRAVGLALRELMIACDVPSVDADRPAYPCRQDLERPNNLRRLCDMRGDNPRERRSKKPGDLCKPQSISRTVQYVPYRVIPAVIDGKGGGTEYNVDQ